MCKNEKKVAIKRILYFDIVNKNLNVKMENTKIKVILDGSSIFKKILWP